MSYLAEGAFEKRLSAGEATELQCIADLEEYGLQYEKNPKQKKTDLIDKHGVYPNIEVKLCKSKNVALCMDEPLYMFIQRYKDSRHGYFSSGPWDTIKCDSKAFFCKYYRCKNYTCFFGFRAYDLVRYCEKAIDDGNYSAKYDNKSNIGNVHPDSCKVVYKFFLPHIKKCIKTWSSVKDFAEGVFESEPPQYRDLYEAYASNGNPSGFKSADLQHPRRPRNPATPGPSPQVQPSVSQLQPPPLALT